MRYQVNVEGSSNQALDLDQHQWLQLLQALGPPPARVSSQREDWVAVLVVDAASQDHACVQAGNAVTAAAAAVGLGQWRVLRCTAELERRDSVKVVPLRPVKTLTPPDTGPVTVQGAISVNADRLGWRGPLRLARLLFVPSQSAKRMLAHLDSRPPARGTTTITVPHVNGALLYPPGPARAIAQALHRRAYDRELRRRGFAPVGADARGTIYRRPAPTATPEE